MRRRSRRTANSSECRPQGHGRCAIKSRGTGAPLACVFFLLAGACTVGRLHTPDSKLEENFILHQTGFEALLAQVEADQGLEMVRADAIRYGGGTFYSGGDPSGMERLGLSSKRLASYSEQLRRLGVAQITKGEGFVEFRVDTGSLINGDSYKGYQYSPTQPAGHRKASLDAYRISEDDKDRFGNFSVYKPLNGNWYLYLFVGR